MHYSSQRGLEMHNTGAQCDRLGHCVVLQSQKAVILHSIPTYTNSAVSIDTLRPQCCKILEKAQSESSIQQHEVPYNASYANFMHSSRICLLSLVAAAEPSSANQTGGCQPLGMASRLYFSTVLLYHCSTEISVEATSTLS
ncbi:unnamed protein product [Musa hybrid cultivar]